MIDGNLGIISRKDKYRIGCRLLRRGADLVWFWFYIKDGNAANTFETENFFISQPQVSDKGLTVCNNFSFC